MSTTQKYAESLRMHLLEKIRSRSATVVVVGQGYVGLPLAVRATEVGFRVVGVEKDERRLDALKAGKSFIEDISDGHLQRSISAGLTFLDDLSTVDLRPDVTVISVPTPLLDGVPDLSFIEAAAEEVGPSLTPGSCVILESTTYPGTTEELLVPILERTSGLKRTQFHVGYSPERIDPGNTKFDLQSTPKVVSGINVDSLEIVDFFFKTLVATTVPVSNCAEAELTKLLENTFRHVNIALINELARFASHLDIDIWNVIEAAETKPFGFMKFTPGPGVGGHCLPVDPSFLAWKVQQTTGKEFRFVELANDINRRMPEFIVERTIALLRGAGKEVADCRVALLGITYKAESSDWRESPALSVFSKLRAEGANVIAVDPMLEKGIELVPDLVVHHYDSVDVEADVAVVLTDHSAFDWATIARDFPLLLDTRNALDGLQFEGERL